MSGTHDATVYIQIEPDFYAFGDPPRVSGLRAVRMTQRRPSRQRGGTGLVKLTIRIPDSAFLPLRPEAIVVIPDNLMTVEPLVVTVEDPS